MDTRLNNNVSHITASTTVAVTNSDNIENDDESNYDNISSTELDSCYNMVVVGRYAEITIKRNYIIIKLIHTGI